MFSLRTRLTAAFATLFAVVLAVTALALTRFAFSFLAEPTLDAIAQSTAITKSALANNPHATPAQLETILAPAHRRGVVVIVFHDRGFGPGGPGPNGRFQAPGQPPATSAAGPDGPPPDGFGGPGPFNGPGGPQRAFGEVPGGALQRYIASQLGLKANFLTGPSGQHVMVGPDVQQIESTVRVYLTTALYALIPAIIVAGLLGRWITMQAIRPLLLVTDELRRFATGDFTPRPVSTRDRSELGALIAAYNGAAAQVSTAFGERARVEEHMRRFVADAGHELRTPLTVISGFLNVLEHGGIDDPAIRERAFATLRVETRRMRGLVERLMVLARLELPEPAHMEAIDVRSAAEGAIAEVSAARHQEIDLIQIRRDDAFVVGDGAELHQAISNLVDNAVKYGAPPVVVRIEGDAETAIVRVRDHGAGIPARERAHVFERFFRGEGRSGGDGSGLGLAIVERAMTRCGGTVVLENGEAGETTFALRMPIRRAPETAELRIG